MLSPSLPALRELSLTRTNDRVGCIIAPANSWPTAPLSTPIIGLKELPPSDTSPLSHTHIMFAHCYKQQGGWLDVLQRWQLGQPTGMLYDLEFLQDERGRRVAAFGYHAGFAGAAVGALALAEQVGSVGEKGRLGVITPYPNEHELVATVKQQLVQVEKTLGRRPTALVIGALGRCGKGAVDFFLKAGMREYVLSFLVAYSRTNDCATVRTSSSGIWPRPKKADPLSKSSKVPPSLPLPSSKLTPTSHSGHFRQLHLPQHQNSLLRLSRISGGTWR